MADSTEIDDRVDLDDDNYTEEDEDGEEQPEDDHDDLKSEEESGKPHLPSRQHADELDQDKHAQLLSLPPHASEVFIGGLPREITEDDLRDLCESMGEISEIRVMRNRDTGETKGFAFVAFKTQDVAQKAIEELHSKEFKGKTLRCSLSETKYRLFIGNLPKNLTDADFRKIVEETGPGAETIELIKDPQNPSRNRGFAFVEYYNNACAEYSKQKMSSSTFKIDGNTPSVTWADPKITPDHSAAASQVKALYVKNIPENTSLEQLKELFQRHGEVTKVVMPPAKSGGKRDFGFVHFAERSSALKAIKEAEKYDIDGQALEVVLAKPQSEKKFDVVHSPSSIPHPNFIPSPGYGTFPVNPYGQVAPGYGAAAAGFQQQPMIYGRGPMPAGMQMVPMVLPDGRIGYVLQQPGVQMPPVRPRRNDRSNGGGGSQGRVGTSSNSEDAGRNRRYRPY